MSIAPGVIILGAEYQALGLLRRLAGEQIPCVLIDQDKWGAARFSRYRSPFHQSPRYDSDEFWPWLVNLAERQNFRGWVLVPTDDEQVRQIARHFDAATAMFRCGGMAWDEYSVLYDKRLNYQWCLRHGITTPKSYIPHSREDVTGMELTFPWIIKPAFKRNFSKHSKAKAIRINSHEELKANLNGDLAAVPVEDLLYQEIIPGDGRNQWSYAGLFVEGEAIAAFTACRRRQHPPDFGRASTYVMAEPNEKIEQESRRIMKLLRYIGLAEVEWKQDPRDGQYKFLEVNARSWGWHSLASHVVGNLPKMFYDHLLGKQLVPVQAQYGWRWVKHVTDLPVALHLWRRNELGLKAYLQSLRGQVTCCEWERGDPLPFFLQFLLVPYLMIKRGY